MPWPVVSISLLYQQLETRVSAAGHREEHSDVAISWRTYMRTLRDCFVIAFLAMTLLCEQCFRC